MAEVEKDTWRVLITASRNLTDAPAVHAVLDAELAAHGRIVLRHGACPTGGDLFAHEWATQHPGVVDEDPMPADWGRPCDGRCRHAPRYRDGERYCAVAGFIRNQDMVDKGADICHGFPQGKSPGTRDCMKRARKARIRVINQNEFNPAHVVGYAKLEVELRELDLPSIFTQTYTGTGTGTFGVDPAVREARERFDALPEQFARIERHRQARKEIGKRPHE